MRKIKIAIISIYFIFLISLVSLELYSQVLNSSLSVMSIIYWMVLIGWLAIIIEKKLKSSDALIWAFALFVISATISVIGFKSLAEVFMKISFIGWLIGITQALLEYKKLNTSN